MTDKFDPTYGRIDSDIRQMVDEAKPQSVGQRVAMENTLQARRDSRWKEDSDGPFKVACPTTEPEPHLLGEFPMTCYRCHIYADS